MIAGVTILSRLEKKSASIRKIPLATRVLRKNTPPLMQSNETSVPGRDTPFFPTPKREAPILDFTGTSVPIGEMTERTDWPQCSLGLFVSINGFDGIVTDIIGHSIKVIAADKTTQRFNAGRLRTLFAPPERTKPAAIPQTTRLDEISKTLISEETIVEESRVVRPVRERILEPDFVAPLRPIRQYATQLDFPKCAFGKHVDIRGYSGVVVEIVDGSLKVQTKEGNVRSFNGAMLRKIYGTV